MSLRSTTGTWVIVSGPVIVGPFDGRSPAESALRELRRKVSGLDAKLQRLHTPAAARRWAELHPNNRSTTP